MKIPTRQEEQADSRQAQFCNEPSAKLEDWEDDFYCAIAKEVSMPTGEFAKFLDAKQAIEDTGFVVGRAEMAKTHAVWIFHMWQHNAPKIDCRKGLSRFFLEVFRRMKLRCDGQDVMVQRVGRNCLVLSVLWHIPAREPHRSMAWEREERRLQELLRELP